LFVVVEEYQYRSVVRLLSPSAHLDSAPIRSRPMLLRATTLPRFCWAIPPAVSRIPTRRPQFKTSSPVFYFQDDIKLNSKLTVNLGLRWDIQTCAY